MDKDFSGIDLNCYDDVCIVHLNQIICIKGNKPEKLDFLPMPVPFLLTVKYEDGQPYYSVFQEQNNDFSFICSGEKITTSDDGSIFLCDTKEDENGAQTSHIYKLELNEKGLYYRVELFTV